MAAAKIDFAKGDGVVPVIVQDHGTGKFWGRLHASDYGTQDYRVLG